MNRRKFLILEDDRSLAEVYAEALRARACDVAVCTRFEDARKQLRRETPDVLITDVRLGDFNGLYLAHVFRMEAAEGMIVVISGYEDPVIRSEAQQLGAEFLLKPVDLPRLIDRLVGPLAR